MAVICPTVTATTTDEYRQQIERIAHFTKRIHLDFMDGQLTPTKSPGLDQIWWPAGVTADVHLMFRRPDQTLNVILQHQPHLAIVHAETHGDFQNFADQLHAAGIKVGVALLANTPVSTIQSGLDLIDHVLIFSGDLGRFGGKADLSLLRKITELKHLKPELEIGWDGGINEHNVNALLSGGVDVLNVGGFIQKADDPTSAYAKLEELVTRYK
ncbi:MAG TPA: hypothetical protein VLF39_01670 [Candidatus Saccharimonadales bacterium]|nr:hypothetical protein [Candidatus Saccharimonadales bacterium]